MFDYSWFMLIGFWFTVGVIQGLLVCLVVWKTISVIVDWFWPKPFPILKAPPYVKDLQVVHRDGHIFVKAKAFGREYRNHVLVASHGSLVAAATAAQIELVAVIAEDNDGSEHY